MTVEATSAQGAFVKYIVTAEDNSDGTVTLAEDGSVIQDKVGRDIAISCSPASGSNFKIGTTPVDCTATDVSGNIRKASFSVTVNADTTDTTAPALSVPADMTVEATSAQGAVVEYRVTADDSVDGSVEVSCTPASGSTFKIGETTVQCTARDSAGNSAEKSFTIRVQDTTDPDVEITGAVDRTGREISSGGTTPVPYIKITFDVTDAVGIDKDKGIECSLDGQKFTSCTSPKVYDRLTRGSHNIIVKATDIAGNEGEDKFQWIVGAPPSRAPEEEQSSSPALEKGQEEQAPVTSTERASTEDTNTEADTDRDADTQDTLTESQSQEPVEESSEEGGEENSTIGDTS